MPSAAALIARACRAYRRRCGAGADFPSAHSSTVSTRGVVTLRNGNGVLARYRHDRAADRLRFMKS
jgi:hypothetical protein